jgi:hypothetical protein
MSLRMRAIDAPAASRHVTPLAPPFPFPPAVLRTARLSLRGAVRGVSESEGVMGDRDDSVLGCCCAINQEVIAQFLASGTQSKESDGRE